MDWIPSRISPRLTGLFTRLYTGLLNTLLPCRCLLCRNKLQPDTALCLEGRICQGCLADLPWLYHGCLQCSLPLPPGQSLCGQCLDQPPPFTRCLTPFYYAPPLDHLISRFKYQSQFSTLPLLTTLLLEYLRDAYKDQPWPQFLVPVPLHWRRQLLRGFNQTEVIARALARELPITLRTDLCRRQRHTRAQQGLTRQERLHSLHRAFRIKGSLDGLHIALLDDVVTTGSTANTLSEALLKAGAEQVDVWALARTPQQQP